jgi:uncharacterized membrane protein YcaP (DUF421 family)
MWFDSLDEVFRVVVAGVVAYVALVGVLRISGKRTLAKLNAFDLVVTVAFGSTLATILLNADVSVAEGVAALALLAAMQFVVAVVSSRVRVGRAVLTSRPTVLVTHGHFHEEAMRSHRIGRNEVRQAIRSSGQGDVSRIAAVVLETDGSLSVISEDQLGDGSALAAVDHSETRLQSKTTKTAIVDKPVEEEDHGHAH